MRKAVFPLLFLGLLLWGCTSVYRPPTIEGYWQGTLRIGEATRTLQLHFMLDGTDITGWMKLILGHFWSVFPITSGSFDQEEGTFFFQAVNPQDPDETYTFEGAINYYSLGGEGTYTFRDQQKQFSWSVLQGESRAVVAGFWEGELSGEGFQAGLRIDLTQSEGWVGIIVGGSSAIFPITSCEVDQERKLVSITARGSTSPGREESYNFEGTFLLVGTKWEKMLGTCHYTSGDREANLAWEARKSSKGQEIE